MTTIDLSQDSDAEVEASYTGCKFVISGPPKAMPRSRFFNNGLFNAKKPDLEAFRAQIRAAIPSTMGSLVFKKGDPVVLKVKFYLKRPEADFKTGKRAQQSGLKALARLRTAAPITPDLDNLVKFVMDGMNKLIYDDDRQVVLIVAYKLRDNGRMEVQVLPFREEATDIF